MIMHCNKVMVVLSGIHNKEHRYYANKQQDRDAMQRELLLLSPLLILCTRLMIIIPQNMATISRMPISVSCEIINTVALRLCVHARSI